MTDWEYIWKSFSIFHSSMNVQKYLLSCYNQIGIAEAEKKSYANCYPFIYYLDHGKSYYFLAKQAPLSIKPILLFYGLIQLIKAALLTVDPQYPESTSVLAHGVSTRKRKKRNYDFLKDEVKVQKNGLFPHFSEKIFHVKHSLEGEKFTMEFLLARIPELNHLFKISLDKQQNYKITSIDQKTLHIPVTILDHLNMTTTRFLQFLSQTLPFEFNYREVMEIDSKNQLDYFKIKLNDKINALNCTPLQYNFFEQSMHIPTYREQFLFFPEIMTHYLLLYNLSMISRYETEWWSELLHGYDSLDYPFIDHFLGVTIQKIPFLFYEYLQQKFE